MTAPAPARFRPADFVLGQLPNLVVFGALAAAFAFGHHRGWKFAHKSADDDSKDEALVRPAQRPQGRVRRVRPG